MYLTILRLDSLLCLGEKARPSHGLEQSVQHQHHLVILHRTLGNEIYSCNVYYYL